MARALAISCTSSRVSPGSSMSGARWISARRTYQHSPRPDSRLHRRYAVDRLRAGVMSPRTLVRRSRWSGEIKSWRREKKVRLIEATESRLAGPRARLASAIRPASSLASLRMTATRAYPAPIYLPRREADSRRCPRAAARSVARPARSSPRPSLRRRRWRMAPPVPTEALAGPECRGHAASRSSPPIPRSSPTPSTLPTATAGRRCLWADSLIGEAFAGRAPEVHWVLPPELRKVARRAPGHRRRSRPDGPGDAALAQAEGRPRSAPRPRCGT